MSEVLNIVNISDGHGFTRERKTRLLQVEEDRKQPQAVSSSRQMTTAEFAVVCCNYCLFTTARKIDNEQLMTLLS